jgi:hypothetical protein
MNALLFLFTFASYVYFSLAKYISPFRYPTNYEEAELMIQDHIRSQEQPTGRLGKTICGENSCCNITETESCNIDEHSRDESYLILPGGKTRCIYSNSSPYAFQVIPGDPDHLLLYFQGGGACWNKQSTFAGLCKANVSTQSYVGVFDRDNEQNAFRNYTIVHISYCSGDIFIGNVTRDYRDKKGKPVVQVGLLNVQSVLDWIKSQMANGGLFPYMTELVLMGCSAGSLGSQLWAPEILKQIPFKRAAVLPDSYVGVFPEGTVGPILYDYGFCESGFLSDDLYQKCINKTIEVVDIGLEYLPKIKPVPISFIQSKTDAMQIAFYIAVAGTENINPPTINPYEFYNETNKIFAAYNQANENFLTYLVDGDQHCFTEQDLYYTADTKGAEDNGYSTDSSMMFEWSNDYPLDQYQKSETVCDRGGTPITYCSMDVSPKVYVEKW